MCTRSVHADPAQVAVASRLIFVCRICVVDVSFVVMYLLVRTVLADPYVVDFDGFGVVVVGFEVICLCARSVHAEAAQVAAVSCWRVQVLLYGRTFLYAQTFAQHVELCRVAVCTRLFTWKNVALAHACLAAWARSGPRSLPMATPGAAAGA